MKNVILITIITFLSISNSVAQLDRTGSFTANMPSVYPISGDVTVDIVNGALEITFESNFSTIQGITLEVFLSHNAIYEPAADLKISTIPLGPGLSFQDPISGSHTFSTPVGVPLYQFDNVLVQCTSANVLWGHANLCESTLNLTTGPLPTDSYTSEQEIICDVSVDQSSMVVFQTGDNVQLFDGFEVSLQSSFETMISATSGCIIE